MQKHPFGCNMLFYVVSFVISLQFIIFIVTYIALCHNFDYINIIELFGKTIATAVPCPSVDSIEMPCPSFSHSFLHK